MYTFALRSEIKIKRYVREYCLEKIQFYIIRKKKNVLFSYKLFFRLSEDRGLLYSCDYAYLVTLVSVKVAIQEVIKG